MEKVSLLPFREDLFEVDADGTGGLLANRCERCGLIFFPRRNFCIQCTKTDRMEEIRLSDRGTLHTYTMVHRASPDLNTPYIIGYVDLKQDGVRIFAPLTECRPEDLEIGMEMALTFGPGPRKPNADDDLRIMTYLFKPAARSCTP